MTTMLLREVELSRMIEGLYYPDLQLQLLRAGNGPTHHLIGPSNQLLAVSTLFCFLRLLELQMVQ